MRCFRFLLDDFLYQTLHCDLFECHYHSTNHFTSFRTCNSQYYRSHHLYIIKTQKSQKYTGTVQYCYNDICKIKLVNINASLGIKKYDSFDHDQMSQIRAFLRLERLQFEKKSKMSFFLFSRKTHIFCNVN